MELTIEELRKLCTLDTIIMTRHVINRCHERSITMLDIISTVMTGEIIKQYLDDKPFPSCLILGSSIESNLLHVVVSSNGDGMFVITAYWPSPDEWESDLKTRKGR